MKVRHSPGNGLACWALCTTIAMQSCSDGRVIGKPVVDETSNGLQLRILQPDGAVAAGATVLVAPGWYVEGAQDSANRSPVADDQGEILMDSLPSGSWWLEARYRSKSIRTLVHWTRSAPREMDLVLADPGTLVGTTEPFATIRVYGSHRSVKADSSGRFLLDSLAAGPVRLRADVPADGSSRLIGESSAQVVAGGTTEAAPPASPSTEAALWMHGRIAVIPPDPRNASDSLADLLVPVVLGASEFSSGLSRFGDLLFADRGGGPLQGHVESWSAAQGRAVVWVRLPWAHPRRGDTLRILWGKPGFVGNPLPPRFDSTYGIWHLDDAIATDNALAGGPSIARDSGTLGAAGMVGSGRSFTGTQWLRIPAPAAASLQRSFTLSCWVLLEGAQRNRAKILDMGPSFQPFGSILLDYDTATGKVGMQIALADSSWQRIESRDPLAGWTHLAATWDGSRGEAVLYRDGAEQGRVRVTQPLLVWPTHDLLLGNQSDGRDGIQGAMDEFRWDQTARTSDWIRHLHFVQSPARIRLEDASNHPP